MSLGKVVAAGLTVLVIFLALSSQLSFFDFIICSSLSLLALQKVRPGKRAEAQKKEEDWLAGLIKGIAPSSP